MQKRTSDFRERLRWLAPIAALSMLGCPKQELAPLGPCTVSAVREEVNQTGISKVDLLFVIDNSQSMREEQANLRAQLPRLIRVLTTGDRYIDRESEAAGVSDEDRFFTPVSSLQLGVITSELGVMRQHPPGRIAGGTEECLESTMPDDGKLLTSVAIAVSGQINDAGVQSPPNPSCSDVSPELEYLRFDTANKTADELADDATQTAREFGCISTVGVRGCAYEQQLEAMWKAVAPSTESDFIDTNSKTGHGNPNGFNKTFIRDDAILAVIQVTDEEDCSITSAGRVLFETPFVDGDTSDPWKGVGLNFRCGIADRDGREDLIRPVKRYIDGLKNLKPANPDRVIFAGLVGIPEDLEDEIARGEYETVLEDTDMTFRFNAGDGQPQPACTVRRPGGSEPELAFPGRRFVQVAAGFGENAALFSICRQSYEPAIDQIIDRIAAKLKGNCLPRQLAPDDEGLVRCEVFEILPQGMTSCIPSKGHVGAAERREVTQAGKTETRYFCKVQQVPVLNDTPGSGEGWYYDSFSTSLKEECDPGEQQRIVFTDNAQLLSGAGATFECFQPVATITANSRGFDAINTRCSPDDTRNTCGLVSDDQYELICIEELLACQVKCTGDPNCPPGWTCATVNEGRGSGPKYCQQATCQTNPSEMTE
jgi:hypothetical protein